MTNGGLILKIDTVSAKDLKKDIDFRIISMMSIDDDDEMVIRELGVGDLNGEYIETMYDRSGVDFFYLVQDELDVKLLEGLGLGVVELLEGKLKGRKLIYNLHVTHDEYKEQDEKLKVAIYMQLTEEDADIKSLEKMLVQDEDLIYIFLLNHQDEIINRLKNSYKKKKVGKVLPFKKKQ